MKNILHKILFLIIGIIMFSCSVNIDSQYRLDKGKAKKQDWYNLFLADLTTANKIDSIDAVMFKSFSSDLMTSAVTPADTIVKRFGKLQETDIKKLYTIIENGNSVIYVITQCNVFSHLYKYNLTNHTLEIIKNKNVIIYSEAEDLILTNNNDSTMIFWAKRKNDQENKEGVTKYFVYNKINKNFCHQRNCKTKAGTEDCEYIKV